MKGPEMSERYDVCIPFLNSQYRVCVCVPRRNRAKGSRRGYYHFSR